MSAIADIQFHQNEFVLTGDIDFSNVMSIYRKSLMHVSSSPNLVFNFEKLKSSNSAGLALIVEWIKLGKKTNQSVQLKALSPDLVSIAKASGLDAVIL